MRDEWNKLLIDRILSKIPAHINPVNYLADKLNLSKESVYRRIKGEVSFTLDDIFILSADLCVSLDEIMYVSGSKDFRSRPVLFDFRSKNILDPKQLFFEIFSIYENGLKNMRHVKTEVVLAVNHLMIFSTVHLDHLFRFHYYKWVHQFQHKPLKFRLADIEIPEEITALRERIKSDGIFVGDNTYILDRNFLKNSLLEVQYYYKRKLISDEELLLIQNDFSSYVDMIEGMVKEKIKSPIFSSHIYVPVFRIESSGLYFKHGNTEGCHFWIYSGSYTESKDCEVCKVYRTFLYSLKKYSTLITGCNEVFQAAFIDQQRQYVKNLTNKDFSYE